MSFPEEWNMKHSPWFPSVILNLASRVRQLASTSSYDDRLWRDLAKGRWEAKNHGSGDNAVMRPPPPGEEEIPKPTKEKKRRRDSPPDTPKPKKIKARKSKIDPAALSADVVQQLREKNEEGDDADYLLMVRKRGSIEALKTDKLVTVEEVHLRTEEISEEGPSRVPESSGVEDASCRDEQTVGVLEGSNFVAVQKGENAQANRLGQLILMIRCQTPYFLKDSFRMPDVGTAHKWDDIFDG